MCYLAAHAASPRVTLCDSLGTYIIRTTTQCSSIFKLLVSLKKEIDCMNMEDVEHVLVVPTQLFHSLGYFQGFSSDVDKYLKTLFCIE